MGGNSKLLANSKNHYPKEKSIKIYYSQAKQRLISCENDYSNFKYYFLLYEKLKTANSGIILESYAIDENSPLIVERVVFQDAEDYLKELK